MKVELFKRWLSLRSNLQGQIRPSSTGPRLSMELIFDIMGKALYASVNEIELKTDISQLTRRLLTHSHSRMIHKRCRSAYLQRARSFATVCTSLNKHVLKVVREHLMIAEASEKEASDAIRWYCVDKDWGVRLGVGADEFFATACVKAGIYLPLAEEWVDAKLALDGVRRAYAEICEYQLEDQSGAVDDTAKLVLAWVSSITAAFAEGTRVAIAKRTFGRGQRGNFRFVGLVRPDNTSEHQNFIEYHGTLGLLPKLLVTSTLFISPGRVHSSANELLTHC